jgi:hypothetical protein
VLFPEKYLSDRQLATRASGLGVSVDTHRRTIMQQVANHSHHRAGLRTAWDTLHAHHDHLMAVLESPEFFFDTRIGENNFLVQDGVRNGPPKFKRASFVLYTDEAAAAEEADEGGAGHRDKRGRHK